MKNNIDEQINTDASVFAESILNAEFGSPLYLKLAFHFNDEMRKAIKGKSNHRTLKKITVAQSTVFAMGRLLL